MGTVGFPFTEIRDPLKDEEVVTFYWNSMDFRGTEEFRVEG